MSWSITLDGLALPLEALQVNRRLNASTWGTFQIVLPTEHVAASLAAETAAVYRGEDLFLSATITEATAARNPQTSMLTVRARLAHIPASPAHWVIAQALSHSEDNGRRVVVVPYIAPTMRPNHTVDDGAATWTVGAILYQVGVDGEQMRIQEVL